MNDQTPLETLGELLSNLEGAIIEPDTCHARLDELLETANDFATDLSDPRL